MLRFSPPIPLPSSPAPPEALGELPNIGIAIRRELFKGRGSRGLDEGSVAPTSPSQQEQPLPSEDGYHTPIPAHNPSFTIIIPQTPLPPRIPVSLRYDLNQKTRLDP